MLYEDDAQKAAATTAIMILAREPGNLIVGGDARAHVCAVTG